MRRCNQMLDLAVNGYSRDEIIKRLHSNRVVKFKYNLLNRNDIKIGELTVLPGGTVALNSLAEIKRTATFRIKEINDIDWLNDRIQPVFCIRMDKDWAEWPLGVFLMSSPSMRIENSTKYRDVEAYDPSLILVEDKFDNRYIITAGTSYSSAIQTILNEAGIWKVNITPHLGVISTDKEFEIGSTKLSAINTLLSEINYTSLWVDENGYFTAKPYVIPSNREAEYIYKNDDLSIIFPGAVEEEDLFSVPNKWVLTASNPEKASLRSVYVNDLPTSRTSTISRGRTIVDFRIIDDVFDQQTLDDKARRLAYETSQIYGKFIFETAIMPHHSFMDILYVEHTDYGISAKYTETSWTMTLSHSGRMQHNARRVIMI
jgi:hypothetical protein